MVPAGIETTHVKVPVIISHNEQIRLDRLSAASAKLPQQLSISRKATFTRVDTRRRENRELFVQSNQPIRVLRLMQRTQPFQVRVPVAQPRHAISPRCVKPRIFQNLKRQIRPPFRYVEANQALRVLGQICNWQVA